MMLWLVVVTMTENFSMFESSHYQLLPPRQKSISDIILKAHFLYSFIIFYLIFGPSIQLWHRTRRALGPCCSMARSSTQSNIGCRVLASKQRSKFWSVCVMPHSPTGLGGNNSVWWASSFWRVQWISWLPQTVDLSQEPVKPASPWTGRCRLVKMLKPICSTAFGQALRRAQQSLTTRLTKNGIGSQRRSCSSLGTWWLCGPKCEPSARLVFPSLLSLKKQWPRETARTLSCERSWTNVLALSACQCSRATRSRLWKRSWQLKKVQL